MSAAWTEPTADRCTCALCAMTRRWLANPANTEPTFDAASAEVDAPDPLLEPSYYPGEYGDIAAAEAENAAERQAERALEWLERGGSR